MPVHKLKALKEMTDVQLQRLAGQIRSELQELSFKRSTGELKHVRQVRSLRQTLARTLTLLNQKSSALTKRDRQG